MRLLQRRGLVLALFSTLLAPGTAAALHADSVPLLRAPLAAPQAVQRTCSARELTPGAAGAVVKHLVISTGGLLDARLDGSPRGADWDLAVFNALTGRMVNASDAFGGNEVVQAPVTAGDVLTIQACRISGPATPIGLSVRDVVLSGKAPKATTQRLVTIHFSKPAQLDRLQREGIDLNETAKGHSIDAVVYGAADLAKIHALGLTTAVKIPDLAAYDRAHVRTSFDPISDALPSNLPSGRRTYRHLVDYENDEKALVAAYPDKVRPVILPGKSLEGRTIQGIEIADDVNATDDGRPTHVEMGLHHVREWPSGEVTMEYAFTLLKNPGKDLRVADLLAGERTFVMPVINPDGLEVTQMAGDSIPVYDDNGYTSLPLALVGAGPYRRMNCRNSTGQPDGLPCAFYSGVDLNRNYAAFWGGPGESPDPGTWPDPNEDYRGTAPYSEPETQAVHAWSSAHQVMVLNSNHTYAGDMLYQPGFSRSNEPGFPKGTVPPHQKEMKALSDAMAKAAGYISEVSYQLYDVTGATEDWNYFSQNTFGYTTESAWQDFHPDYQDGVIDQYLGTADGYMDQAEGYTNAKGGLQESFLLAGEAALNPAYHGVIEGNAPPGATLTIDKSFTTSTSYVEDSSGKQGPALQIPEHLTSTLTVPPSGHYVWAVNPSTRPVVALAGGTEAWTLTCGGESHDLVVGMGQTVQQDLHC
jgi:hypothetical protein